MSIDRDSTLIFGCGYIGRQVALQWQSQSQSSAAIYTVTRNRDKAQQLAAEGFQPLIADWTDRRTLAQLPACGRVLIAVSYDRRSGLSRQDSQVGGLNQLLDFLPPQAAIVYLSTTGVYHQRDGSWVDETSVTRPQYPGGWAHLRAEESLQRWRPAGRATILRLSGIYGPGRVPRLHDLQAGRSLGGGAEGYLNLIHRDDAVAAILAAWQRMPDLPRLHLVSDDQPVLRRRFYEHAAQLWKTPPPQFDPQLSPTQSQRSGSHKRVWNRRMHQHLLPRLQYPTFVQGLNDLVGQLC